MSQCLIWSHEHSGWWRSNQRGYTRDIRQAGIYTLEEAREIVKDANLYRWKNDVPNEVPVRVEDLPEEARELLK